MYIKKLTLRSFRNYDELTIEPDPGINLLFGPNGSGKTNLLEAIHYCALGRSHRISQDREVVMKGQPFAACDVTVQKKSGSAEVGVRLTPDQKPGKTIYIGRKKAPRIAELMGQLQCVIFSPEDLMLIREAPPVRRRFMDMLLSQTDRGYFIALQQYQRALDQRNALLHGIRRGEMRRDNGLLAAFEESMAENSARIIPARDQMLQKLGELAQECYLSISGRAEEPFRVLYRSCTENPSDPAQVRQEVLRRLEAGRDEEILRGTTGYGLHREDMVLKLKGEEMKTFASQGQVRTAALSLKLSQLKYFKAYTGEEPILLLDDVMSELDMDRRIRLLQEIEGIQTFVTCTDRSDLSSFETDRSYLVRLDENSRGTCSYYSGRQLVGRKPEEIEDPVFD